MSRPVRVIVTVLKYTVAVLLAIWLVPYVVAGLFAAAGPQNRTPAMLMVVVVAVALVAFAVAFQRRRRLR